MSAVENSGSSTRREERGGTFILFIALYRAKYLDLFSLAHCSLSPPEEACAVHVRAHTHTHTVYSLLCIRQADGTVSQPGGY